MTNWFQTQLQKCTDEALVCKMATRDTEAFDELYRRYSPRMRAYFFRMLGNNEEKAQDFLQELFIKIIEKSHLFRKDARFSTWIFTIAHNMCKNEYRRLAVRKVIDYDAEVAALPESAAASLDDSIDFRALNRVIDVLLERFDARQRTSFILRFREGLSIREISDILGCSEGTTKSRLFYTTRRLTGLLKRYHPQNGAPQAGDAPADSPKKNRQHISLKQDEVHHEATR